MSNELEIGTINVTDNKPNVETVQQATRSTLLVLPNFNEKHVNKNVKSIDIVNLSSTEEMFEKFGEKNSDGNFIFAHKVNFKDGKTDHLEVENMAGFSIDKLSEQSDVISNLNISKEILLEIKGIKSSSLNDFIRNTSKIEKAIKTLEYLKNEIINKSLKND